MQITPPLAEVIETIIGGEISITYQS